MCTKADISTFIPDKKAATNLLTFLLSPTSSLLLKRHDSATVQDDILYTASLYSVFTKIKDKSNASLDNYFFLERKDQKNLEFYRPNISFDIFSNLT